MDGLIFGFAGLPSGPFLGVLGLVMSMVSLQLSHFVETLAVAMSISNIP